MARRIHKVGLSSGFTELCGQGQNLTWASEVQRRARQQKHGKSWRWEVLDSCPPSLWVPYAAMCFRCSWARLILVTPACLWTMKTFLGRASKELFKATSVMSPGLKALTWQWPLLFRLCECGTNVESHTWKGLNQNLINTFILFSNLCSLFYIWVCWSLEWLRGLAVIATQPALHAEHFVFLCLENFK